MDSPPPSYREVIESNVTSSVLDIDDVTPSVVDDVDTIVTTYDLGLGTNNDVFIDEYNDTRADITYGAQDGDATCSNTSLEAAVHTKTTYNVGCCVFDDCEFFICIIVFGPIAWLLCPLIYICCRKTSSS